MFDLQDTKTKREGLEVVRLGRFTWGMFASAGAGLVLAFAYRARRPVTRGATLLVGDSLGVGLAKPLAALGMPLVSIAEPGTTVTYWIVVGGQRLRQALAEKPGWVFVSLGVNDAYNGDAYATTAASATASLLATLTESGAHVFWIGPPKLPSSYNNRTPSQAVLDAIRAVVDRTAGATWIDNAVVNIPRTADQLHPTDEGYAAWANLLVDELALFFVALQPASSDKTAFSADDIAEPSPRPPPPSVVSLPPGWVYLRDASRPMRVFALSILVQRRPIGDLQTKSIEGRQVGALTEWHWDDHVDHTWKWHRGISLLKPMGT